MTIEEKLYSLNLKLPEAPKPVGAYVPSVLSGDLLFLAGQIPRVAGKTLAVGRLGEEFSVNEVKGACQACVLNALSAAKAALGDLERIRRVVRLSGYVASAEGFTDQAGVLNHASNLLIAILGERGRHARLAIGVAELPLGVPVELEMILEVAPS